MADDDLHAIELGVYGASRLYDAATEAIAAAFTTPPDEARKILIDDCVLALKSGGIWTKLDGLYGFAAADSQAAKINWVNPGTYNCTEVNAPSFTADRGFTGASTKYLDSQFNPSTASSPKYVRNSASAFAHSNTNVAVVGGLVGGAVGAAPTIIYPRYTNNNYYIRVNDTANMSQASTDSTGFWAGDRMSSSTSATYKNGSVLFSGASPGASIAVENANLRFLSCAAEYWTGQVSSGGMGQSLSSGEHTALYNAMRAYMTGVGVP